MGLLVVPFLVIRYSSSGGGGVCSEKASEKVSTMCSEIVWTEENEVRPWENKCLINRGDIQCPIRCNRG
jgi:hypothetical protein